MRCVSACYVQVGSAGVEEADKLRLVLLFALRYEKDGRPQIMQLLKQLQVWAVSPLAHWGEHPW